MASCNGIKSNWKLFENHCYLFLGDQARTWRRAEELCVGGRGHLASITSHTIRGYVTSEYKVNAPLWIGARRLEGEVSWSWADVSPWIYESWGPEGGSGPDKDGGNCASLSKSEGFEHRSCAEGRGFICSQKICQPTTTTTGESDSPSLKCKSFPRFNPRNWTWNK